MKIIFHRSLNSTINPYNIALLKRKQRKEEVKREIYKKNLKLEKKT